MPGAAEWWRCGAGCELTELRLVLGRGSKPMPEWTQSRPLLVGLCTPPDEVGGRPIDGLTAARLASIVDFRFPGWLSPVGATPGELLECYCDLAVLWPVYEAKRPAGETRARANALDVKGKVVVLCGREVASAFRDRLWQTADWFQWVEPAEGDDAAVYVLVPSANPRCRLYNSKEWRERTAKVLRRAIDIAA